MRANPDKERRFHVATEALSVFVAAPFLTWVALANPTLPRWQRWGLLGLAAASIGVDGWLLYRWKEEER